MLSVRNAAGLLDMDDDKGSFKATNIVRDMSPCLNLINPSFHRAFQL